MKFSVFQASSQGGRKKNEDRMGYCYTRESSLFLLADGMGGHPQGEVAAQLALQSCSALFQREATPVLVNPADFLVSALHTAHRRIAAYATEQRMRDSPRTTLVAAVMQHGFVTWIHCGDSRLYMVRAGQLLKRTRDHSYAEHAARVPQRPIQFNRNVLFTCIGSPADPMYDLSEPQMLQHGDRIVLCSDGLWGALPDPEIVVQIDSAPVDQSVPALIDQALARAGASSDNVTVIGVEWIAPDAAAAVPTAGSQPGEFLDSAGYASTIQDVGRDGMLLDVEEDDELDEATIERTIAEINEAIRRTAARRV